MLMLCSPTNRTFTLSVAYTRDSHKPTMNHQTNKIVLRGAVTELTQFSIYAVANNWDDSNGETIGPIHWTYHMNYT